MRRLEPMQLVEHRHERAVDAVEIVDLERMHSDQHLDVEELRDGECPGFTEQLIQQASRPIQLATNQERVDETYRERCPNDEHHDSGRGPRPPRGCAPRTRPFRGAAGCCRGSSAERVRHRVALPGADLNQATTDLSLGPTKFSRGEQELRGRNGSSPASHPGIAPSTARERDGSVPRGTSRFRGRAFL